MVGIAEVGGVQGQHQLGGVLDRRDGLPGPAPMPGPAVDGQKRLQQAPLGHAKLQVGRLGDQAGVAVDQALFEQGPGAEAPAALLVGYQVEHHVAGRRLTGPLQDRQGADGRGDAALHIGGAPTVEPPVFDPGIEGIAGPRLRR